MSGQDLNEIADEMSANDDEDNFDEPLRQVSLYLMNKSMRIPSQ